MKQSDVVGAIGGPIGCKTAQTGDSKRILGTKIKIVSNELLNAQEERNELYLPQQKMNLCILKV